MKMSKVLMTIAAVMALVLAFTACNLFNPVDKNQETTPG